MFRVNEKDRAWGDASALKNKPAERAGGEEAISPWFMMIAHVGAEVYLEAMVMGGVFERFPKLRFGACEVLGQWVGPLAQNLDFWNEHQRKFSLHNTDGRLPIRLKPSEYIRRNVRVSRRSGKDL